MPCAVVQIVLMPGTPDAWKSTHVHVEAVHRHGRRRDLVAGEAGGQGEVLEEPDPVRRGVEVEDLVLGLGADRVQHLARPSRAARRRWHEYSPDEFTMMSALTLPVPDGVSVKASPLGGWTA